MRQTADTAIPVDTEEPRIYSGETAPGGTNFVRGNRPLKRRKRSPFKLISLLVMISMLILLYVWNKISVNRLADEVADLRKQLELVRGDNQELNGTIDRSMNLNRIREYALRHLKLQDARDLPVWFDVPDYTAGSASGDRVESLIHTIPPAEIPAAAGGEGKRR